MYVHMYVCMYIYIYTYAILVSFPGVPLAKLLLLTSLRFLVELFGTAPRLRRIDTQVIWIARFRRVEEQVTGISKSQMAATWISRSCGPKNMKEWVILT